MEKFIEKAFLEYGVLPKNITGAAQTGQCVSMKNYEKIGFLIQAGAWAGGASAFTLEQCTAVAGTGAKAQAFTKYWKKSDTGEWAEQVATSNTFDVDTANYSYYVEIKASEMDVANGFDCIRAKLASPGANNDFVSVLYALLNPRYGQAALPDPKVD